MKSVIRIGVYGGIVQWVQDVPHGVELKVQDYDVDGVDSGILSSDSDGNACVVTIYRNDASKLPVEVT